MQHQIIQNNYLHIPSFITSKEISALNKEFKEHAVKFNLPGDPQASNSHSIYNFLPFVRLLVEKIPDVSNLLGEKVLPTYSYARIYKEKSILGRHRDRPACEISLTLNLQKDCDWPIFFQKANGTEYQIELDPGDAVMYLGCQSDHWREEFRGKEYVQVFLHYVRAHGPKAWAFFDKQQQQEPTPPFDKLPVAIL